MHIQLETVIKVRNLSKQLVAQFYLFRLRIGLCVILRHASSGRHAWNLVHVIAWMLDGPAGHTAEAVHGTPAYGWYVFSPA
jgi:hypothetical protein